MSPGGVRTAGHSRPPPAPVTRAPNLPLQLPTCLAILPRVEPHEGRPKRPAAQGPGPWLSSEAHFVHSSFSLGSFESPRGAEKTRTHHPKAQPHLEPLTVSQEHTLLPPSLPKATGGRCRGTRSLRPPGPAWPDRGPWGHPLPPISTLAQGADQALWEPSRWVGQPQDGQPEALWPHCLPPSNTGPSGSPQAPVDTRRS